MSRIGCMVGNPQGINKKLKNKKKMMSELFPF